MSNDKLTLRARRFRGSSIASFIFAGAAFVFPLVLTMFNVHIGLGVWPFVGGGLMAAGFTFLERSHHWNYWANEIPPNQPDE